MSLRNHLGYRVLILVFPSMAVACGGAKGTPRAEGPVQAEVPLRRGERLVLTRTEANGVALFADEREALRKLAAHFLVNQADTPGLTLVPLAEVDAVERLAAEHKRRDGGPRCLAPLPLATLLAERWPGLARATTKAVCTGSAPCQLGVEVARPQPFGWWPQAAAWQAEVDRSHDLATWQGAVARLVAQPPDTASNSLEVTTSAPSPPAMLVEVAPAFSGEAPGGAHLTQLQTNLGACHDPTQQAADTVTLAIDAAGKAKRCLVDSRDEPLRSEARTCLCRVAQAFAFEPGRDRRLVLSVRNTRDVVRAANGGEFSARFDDPVASDGTAMASYLAAAEHAMAQCHAADAPAGHGSLSLGVRMLVEPTGRVTEVATRQTVRSSLAAPPTLQLCVETALRQVRLPCSRDERPWSVDALLVLQGRPLQP